MTSRAIAIAAIVSGLVVSGLVFSGPRFGEKATAKPNRSIDTRIEILSANHTLSPVALPGLGRRVGSLRYIGGLHLESPDKNFGGFSGLALVDDGQGLIAIADSGAALSASLVRDDTGRIVRLENAHLTMLENGAGNVLSRSDSDAEGFWTDGETALISFERNGLIRRYTLDSENHFKGGAVLFDLSDESGLLTNKGLEAVARLDKDRILTVVERPFGRNNRAGTIPAYLLQGDSRRTLAFARTGSLDVTDVSVHGGRLYLLERYYARKEGLRIRLSVAPLSAIEAPGPVVTTTLADMTSLTAKLDNFEGLSVYTIPGGRTRLLIISDDNFSARQKTLLMEFELVKTDQ